MSEQPPIRHFAIIRFGKTGRTRFLSHLDLARAVDRAVRRAGLPVKYSEGFNPSAQIGYASALPVGTAAEAEPCQIELTRPMPADEIHRALAAELPEGITLADTRVGSGPRRKHISGSEIAEYEIELDASGAPCVEALRQGVLELLDAGELMVLRETKSQTREIDVRPGIQELSVVEPRSEEAGPRIRMTLALQQDKLVKPSEVIEWLERRLFGLTGRDVRLDVRVVTRLGLR